TPSAQWLEQRLAGANVVLRGRDAQDMLTAAVSGAGIAVLPCLIAAGEPTLRRLTPAVIATRPLSIVYRKEARSSTELRAVVRFVSDVVREQMDALRDRSSLG